MNNQVENTNTYELPAISEIITKFLRIFFISQVVILILVLIIGIFAKQFFNTGTVIILGFSILLLLAALIYLLFIYKKNTSCSRKTNSS